MALRLKYQGINREKSADGTIITMTWYGTQAECEENLALANINSTAAGLGRLVSAGIRPAEGGFWEVYRKYSTAGYASGSSVTAPSTVVGEKSATMNCSMMSTPLEQHPNYKLNWNHWLAARYKTGSAPSAPSWWTNQGASYVIPSADQKTFKVLNSNTELPQSPDLEGYTWEIIDTPAMPGVTSYDVACYTQQEKARYRNFADACAAVKNRANKTFTSAQIVNNGFTGGNWKGDGASIAWDGEYWIATFTYTFSANASGWNSTLYEAYT